MNSGGTVYRALNKSIEKAVEAGRIDKDAQAALIAAARKVARVMDEPGWPIIFPDGKGGGKFDNVSPATLLKYCEALGISPKEAKEAAKPKRSALADARASVRVLKVGA